MIGYDALRNHAAWIDLSARGKIKLTGEDRARLLHAMTTNHIQQLTPGSGCYAFFLNDKGRVLADANVLCRPDYFLLDVEPETREPLYQHLDRFIIADDVTLEDVTDATATIAMEGPEAASVLERAGAPVPEAEYSSVDWGNAVVARLNSTGSSGFFMFAPAAEKQALISQARGRRRGACRRRSSSSSSSGARQAPLWRRYQRAVSGPGSESTAGAQLQQGLLPGAGDRGARSIARPDPPRAEAANTGDEVAASAWNKAGGCHGNYIRGVFAGDGQSSRAGVREGVNRLLTRAAQLRVFKTLGTDRYPTIMSFFTEFTTIS